jgi:hypothetical protein
LPCQHAVLATKRGLKFAARADSKGKTVGSWA